jgi:hypothetical protein
MSVLRLSLSNETTLKFRLDLRMMIANKWILAFAAATQVAFASLEDPDQAFLRPPDSAKPGVWWHWMGSEDWTRPARPFNTKPSEGLKRK